MTLAKGSKLIFLILAVAYVIFLAVFFYQSFVKHGLVSVPRFETGTVALPVSADETALEKFVKDYVETEVIAGENGSGRYRIAQMRSRELGERIKEGATQILGAEAGSAAKADAFAKKRYMSAAQIKAPDGKVVLDKAVELGLMQIELLTRHGVAGEIEIPVQGHGEIIGINATMGFVILNFLMLSAFLYALLWGPITGMLDDRTASIRKDIEQASASREDADKLKVRYEQALANARSEANRLRQEKIREGDAERNRIITQAREEARRLSEDAKTQVEAAVVEAKRELRKEVSGISVEIAAQILAREVDQNVHRKLIDDFLRNLETEKV